jgi:predicted ATPase/DNA-binding CsgD family transcriptional regulator
VESTSPPRRAGNLPADLTSFVGRRGDIAEVKNLLSTSRLVSLVGPGGVGKTRLVLKVAADLRRAFSDGVWLVELADVNEPMLVAQTIADTVRISVRSRGEAPEVLAREFRDRRMLIILDNCEHLLETSAALVAELLRSSPQLRILTTTRQPLRVSGEVLHMVTPLEVPDPRLPLAPGAATQYAAMSLFVDRAQAVVPSFTLTAENEAAVAHLCQRLEGIPLAIELAAVSLRVLSVQELAASLDERFDLLTSGPRTAPERHQTLEATIDWSYDLCTPDEQELWASCSVFAGHFDRAAAEVVCASEEIPGDAVLGVVAGLVDKSVLVRDEVDGVVRFGMSEMVRHYGLDRLRDKGREDDIRDAHTRYFAGLVAQAAAEAFGPLQEGWLLALQRDHANLREALDHSLARPTSQHAGLRLAATAWLYWVASGHLLEGRHWLDRALFSDTKPSSDRARALWTNGFLAVLEGDRAVGNEFIDEALQVAAEVNDSESEACATHVKGLAALFAGDLTLATSLLERAGERYSELGLVQGLPTLLRVHRGLAYLFGGEPARATALIESARQLSLANGEKWIYSEAVQAAAIAEFQRGDASTAKTLVAESLATKRVFHDALGIASGLDILGWVAASEGRAEFAATLLGSAHRIGDSVGEPGFGSRHFAALRSTAEDTIRQSAGDDLYDDAYARGAALDLDQAVALALGEPEPELDTDRTDPAVGLTPRETQVAELVGKGLSNREIAATLVISQRTAEGHVQRILTKFGFTSRAQVATWVAEQRLPGPLLP